jgi:hypothetical protein
MKFVDTVYAVYGCYVTFYNLLMKFFLMSYLRILPSQASQAYTLTGKRIHANTKN